MHKLFLVTVQSGEFIALCTNSTDALKISDYYILAYGVDTKVEQIESNVRISFFESGADLKMRY